MMEFRLLVGGGLAESLVDGQGLIVRISSAVHAIRCILIKVDYLFASHGRIISLAVSKVLTLQINQTKE